MKNDTPRGEWVAGGRWVSGMVEFGLKSFRICPRVIRVGGGGSWGCEVNEFWRNLTEASQKTRPYVQSRFDLLIPQSVQGHRVTQHPTREGNLCCLTSPYTSKCEDNRYPEAILLFVALLIAARKWKSRNPFDSCGAFL